MATQDDLAQLIVPVTEEQLFNQMIALATKLGFPTSSWQSGGTEESRFLLFAKMLSDVASNFTPGIAAGGLVPLATTGFLSLLASNYALERLPASPSDGYMTFDTTASGAGPYSLDAGSVFSILPDNLRYYNVEDFTIPSGGSIANVLMRSEFDVNTSIGLYYNEGPNQAISLLNPLPGVQVTNPEQIFSSVVHNGVNGGRGVGTGSVTPSGVPINKYFVIVRIDTSGEAGVAKWSYSLDGNEFINAGAVVSAELFDGAVDTNVLVTLSAGVPTPSFIAGDTYSFSTIQSWIVVQGADEESDDALRARLINRWPTLASIPTNGFYYELVTSTPGVGAQVTQVVVQVDGYVNNKINVVIAGPDGQLTAETIDTVQDWVNPRVPTTEFPVVVSPGSQAIGIDATITVTAAQYSTLFGTTGFDGLVGDVCTTTLATTKINGTIRIAKLTENIMELDGLVDLTGVLLNGDPSNIVLGSLTTFQLGFFDSDLSTFTWVQV